MLFKLTDQSPSGKIEISLWRVGLLLLLIVGNVFFGIQYINLKSKLSAIATKAETQVMDKKMLEFAKLFIEKVLKAKGEIDFETRLQLENAVRDLKDQDILNKWQAFTESNTEGDAQIGAKDLLGSLIGKIEVK